MKLTKKQTLDGIIKAAELVSNNQCRYTCKALARAGCEIGPWYWSGLFQAQPHMTVGLLWSFNGWGRIERNERNIKMHRLIMLAWLYEMVRSGEFNNFK